MQIHHPVELDDKPTSCEPQKLQGKWAKLWYTPGRKSWQPHCIHVVPEMSENQDTSLHKKLASLLPSPTNWLDDRFSGFRKKLQRGVVGTLDWFFGQQIKTLKTNFTDLPKKLRISGNRIRDINHTVARPSTMMAMKKTGMLVQNGRPWPWRRRRWRWWGRRSQTLRVFFYLEKFRRILKRLLTNHPLATG